MKSKNVKKDFILHICKIYVCITTKEHMYIIHTHKFTHTYITINIQLMVHINLLIVSSQRLS